MMTNLKGMLDPHIVRDQAEIAEKLQDVLELAENRMHDSVSGENMTECRCCGDVDGHAAGCPVPAIEAWLA
jgi:hypothetical protein